MSGTGKKADQKKTLIIKLYGKGYFGKKGITSKKTQKDKRQRINLKDIESNLESYIKQGIAKKVEEGYEINLKDYKLLGKGKIKTKLRIKVLEASKSAIENVKKAGGEIIIKEKKKIETPLVERPKKIEKK
jgi:ribosomal protein L15